MSAGAADDYRKAIWSEERCEFGTPSEGCYRFALPDMGLEFIADRLRRSNSELHCEMRVLCSLPGALTVEGNVLSVADMNLSSVRARQERARYLAGRARDGETDWLGLLEEFSLRVLRAERTGQPAVLLRDLPKPKPDDTLTLHGLSLPRKHPSILFGDGGTLKSYLALYFVGCVDRGGVRVGVFDWELSGEDHRERLERLFGSEMPSVYYARCTRPLLYESDRLRRIVGEQRLDYAVLDSIAPACDGPPEAAEVAGRYFQALRQLGIGTLNVAHVSKAEGADQKPFGSAFWHNLARSTWFAKVTEATSPDCVTLGLFNRKANLGPLCPPVGFEVLFAEDRTAFRRVDVADVPDLAKQMTVRQRMYAALRNGALGVEDVALKTDADLETIKRTARRYPKLFTTLPGGKLGLAERRPA